MNYSQQMSDAINLINTLMRSTAKYVAHRMHNDRDVAHYLNAFNKCLPTLQDDLYTLKSKINRTTILGDLLFPEAILDLDRAKRTAHAMACKHAIDIVDSVEKRFFIGQQAPEYILTQDIGEMRYEDWSFFGPIQGQ